MENKEKFAFRKVKMSEGVEVEFIKLLTSVETKNDEDVIKAFKVQFILWSINLPCRNVI